jgi:peptide/nickel transport system permease protein
MPTSPPPEKSPALRLAAADLWPVWMLAFITVIAVIAPWVTPFDPYLRTGRAYQPPSTAHWLGTDEIGRDLLSRVLIGVRLTWMPTLGIIAIGGAIGTVIGSLSGAMGGVVDLVLQRITEVFQVLPSSVLALAVTATLGPGLVHTMIAISLFWWPWYSRLVRAEIRACAVLPHAAAARLAGASGLRLFWRHLFPAALPTLFVTMTLDVSIVILTLAMFSFVGLGAPAPAPELGAMSARTLQNLSNFWWLPVVPAVAVMLLAFTANMAGDALRARLETV